MTTISALDYLSRHAVNALKDTIADFDEATDLLNHVYDDIKLRYEAQRYNLDPDVRAMMCRVLARIQWAIETTKHVHSILDRKVLYLMVTRDDTQSQ